MFFTGIYDWEKKYGLRSILQIQRQKKKNKSLLGAENCKMIL